MRISRIAILAALFLAACGTSIRPGDDGNPVACTMDARVCPDGSAVGRVPPDCEFAPCPGEPPAASSASVAARRPVSDGVITVSYAGTPFRLAMRPEQMGDSSHLPQCESGFDYCFHHDGAAYAGTNFDGAGLAIAKRADLATESACLTTVPDGYAHLKPQVHADSGYDTSLFAPLGGAGTGHAARVADYRLFVSGACYELRTRIATAQYGDDPAGSVREFTANDEAEVQGDLGELLANVSLADGTRVIFP